MSQQQPKPKEMALRDDSQDSTMPETVSTSATKQQEMLALPAPSAPMSTANTDKPSNETDVLNVGGSQTIKMEHLGPMIINSDGTLSRISNWAGMSDTERERTVRILSKRNMLRRERMTDLEHQEDGNVEKT